MTDPDTQVPKVEMAGRMGPGIPGPQLDLVLYSRHQEKLLRTRVNTRGGGRFHLPGSLQLTVSDSEHPMARRLVRMGLDRARPAGVFVSHSLQLRLNAGFSMT